MIPDRAGSEGRAAAADAVAQASSLGIGPANPIYDDMEGYAVGRRNTPAVMAFLAGWTGGLHARGYFSGVYSSASSGIADLVARHGASFHEPDDIWIADWNGQATTGDWRVPAGDWPNRQRIHQFLGPHEASYGGARIDIDSDYCDAAVVTSATLHRRH
jgi:hypothetical protein